MQNTRFENIKYRLKNSSPETWVFGFLQHTRICVFFFFRQRTDRHHGQYFVFKIFLVLNSRSVTVQQLKEQKKMSVAPSSPFPNLFYRSSPTAKPPKPPYLFLQRNPIGCLERVLHCVVRIQSDFSAIVFSLEP